MCARRNNGFCDENASGLVGLAVRAGPTGRREEGEYGTRGRFSTEWTDTYDHMSAVAESDRSPPRRALLDLDRGQRVHRQVLRLLRGVRPPGIHRRRPRPSLRVGQLRGRPQGQPHGRISLRL